MTDDDIDPVEEIRAIRQKIWRKYKTMDAYFDHFNAIPTADTLLAQVRAKLENAKVKPKGTSAPRRRKSPTHT